MNVIEADGEALLAACASCWRHRNLVTQEESPSGWRPPTMQAQGRGRKWWRGPGRMPGIGR